MTWNTSTRERTAPRRRYQSRGPDLRRKAPLTLAQVLAWADAHFIRTGSWPTVESGRVFESRDEKWLNIDQALRQGWRELPRGLSLARLLVRRLGARNRANVPPLTLQKVLTWADAHRRRTGRWPTPGAGEVPDAPGETWWAVEVALRRGRRGLSGGSSLALLLAQRRGRPRGARAAPLRVEEVLRWADLHRGRTGRWPSHVSGPVRDAPGESWAAINQALRCGHRGLPSGTSLSRLLRQYGRRWR